MIEKTLKDKISSEHLLIFDLDGTLIHTDEVNFLSYKEAIQKVKKMDIDFLCEHDGRFTRREIYLVIKHLSIAEYKNIIKIKDDVYHKYLHKSKIDNFILKMIIEFSQKNKIILATNSHKDRANMVLEYHKLKNLFDYKFYKEDYKNNNKFLHSLDNLNIEPKLAMVFENDDNEIKKAILCGIPDKNIIKV